MDEFIDIELTRHTLARYTIRKGIKNAIDACLKFFKGDVLDVGCGKMPYRDYINEHAAITSYTGIDLESGLNYSDEVKPDLLWDGKVLPLEDGSFDTALLTEVLEHVHDPDQLLKEVHRVLRPGGCIFFTVPFLWNLHETPHDHYRYTPYALEKIFVRNHFHVLEMGATGGWHASMAQMLGLWAARSGLTVRRKKLMQRVALWAIPRLLNWDRAAPGTFAEGQMITGIYGILRKQ